MDLPLTGAEESAEQNDYHIERIDNLQQECRSPVGVRRSFSYETILNRELNNDKQWAYKL